MDTGSDDDTVIHHRCQGKTAKGMRCRSNSGNHPLLTKMQRANHGHTQGRYYCWRHSSSTDKQKIGKQKRRPPVGDASVLSKRKKNKSSKKQAKRAGKTYVVVKKSGRRPSDGLPPPFRPAFPQVPPVPFPPTPTPTPFPLPPLPPIPQPAGWSRSFHFGPPAPFSTTDLPSPMNQPFTIVGLLEQQLQTAQVQPNGSKYGFLFWLWFGQYAGIYSVESNAASGETVYRKIQQWQPPAASLSLVSTTLTGVPEVETRNKTEFMSALEPFAKYPDSSLRVGRDLWQRQPPMNVGAFVMPGQQSIPFTRTATLKEVPNGKTYWVVQNQQTALWRLVAGGATVFL